MMRLLKSEEMQRVEQNAANYGLSFQRMMENAGAACARNIRSVVEKENLSGRVAAIICGKGNNGGDGFVIARKLLENGYRVTIILAAGYPHTEIAQTAFSMTRELSIPTISFETEREKAVQTIKSADLLVDAVFGFGFYGAVRELQRALFQEINAAKGLVFAVDVPSGVYCDSGLCDPHCVRADVTIAISALKPAHILHPAAGCCGDIIVAGIGIPEDCFTPVESSMFTYSAAEVAAQFPARSATANKGDFGHLLSICGSRQMPGAATMAATAALRSGVGLVTAAFPQSMYPVMAAKLTETLLLPLPETASGTLHRDCIPLLLERLDRYSAITIGCGLSVCDDTAAVLQAVLEHAKVPVIVDADGINILARNIDILQNAAAPVILTPHPKEMARLLGTDVKTVQSDRMGVARAFSQTHGVYLVLKGANTVVACPNNDRVYVNATGNNGLAKGGSGDVLAGMIGALCASQFPLPQAAQVGVYLHGHAADTVAARLSKTGMLPTDVIAELGVAFAAFES